MSENKQSEAPSIVTPQDIRDIFNRYGMNYSQIVGEENTIVSASLYTYNKAIDDIVAKINRLMAETTIAELKGVLVKVGRYDSDSLLDAKMYSQDRKIRGRIKELENGAA